MILVCAASAGCFTPRAGFVNVDTKPGWGRLYSPEEERTTVRAVPAAAKPSIPPTAFGKPGWGQP